MNLWRPQIIFPFLNHTKRGSLKQHSNIHINIQTTYQHTHQHTDSNIHTQADTGCGQPANRCTPVPLPSRSPPGCTKVARFFHFLLILNHLLHHLSLLCHLALSKLPTGPADTEPTYLLDRHTSDRTKYQLTFQADRHRTAFTHRKDRHRTDLLYGQTFS